MIVIIMQVASIQTEVFYARAMLDTQAMERFVKVFITKSMHDRS